MVRKNYVEDILAGNHALCLENELLSSLIFFVEACEDFFEMDVSTYTLRKESLAVIQHLLEQWFSIKHVFLDEQQFASGEAIKHYYSCYQLHPYLDCFDLLTYEISPLLSSLKIRDGKINIEHDNPIVNKLITFHQHCKADFLKKVMAYKRMDEDRYKKVIGYYEQFKQLPFSAGRDKKIYYFSIGLEIPKGFLWAQLYYAIQQMYKYVNQLFIKYNVLVIRIFTVDGNLLKFKFICMGVDGMYSLCTNDIIAKCRSVFFCAFGRFLGYTIYQPEYIPIPDNTAHIKEHLQSLENGQLILEKLQALITKPDEIRIESTFKSILTPKNANKVNELWDSLNHQYWINGEAKDSIRRILLDSSVHRTHIEGLYSFQILNKQAFTNLDWKC